MLPKQPNEFSSAPLPRFWAAFRAFHIVLLLQVDVPPSHGDGYQGKALLQRPGVHHGFHIKAFLLPVLVYTEKHRCMTHLDPTKKRQNPSFCSQTELLSVAISPLKLLLIPPLLPAAALLPSPLSPTTARGPWKHWQLLLVLFLYTCVSWEQVPYLVLLGIPWAWHRAQSRHVHEWMNESREGKVARCATPT